MPKPSLVFKFDSQHHHFVAFQINVLSEFVETCLLMPEKYDNTEKERAEKVLRTVCISQERSYREQTCPRKIAPTLIQASEVGSTPPVTTKRISAPFPQCSLTHS